MKDRTLQLLRSVMSAEPPIDLISSPKIYILLLDIYIIQYSYYHYKDNLNLKNWFYFFNFLKY